jgi:uncharacterized protein YndB with AHSA1/START domain
MTAPATQSIVVDYELPKPPRVIWRALTEPPLLAAWLMENDIRPVVGHRFTFRAPPVPGWDGVVHCEVLAVEAEKLLRYSWKGGSSANPGYGSALDSLVTWTLRESPSGGTLLHLEHSGFTQANAFAYQNMSKGWQGKLAQRIGQAVAGL